METAETDCGPGTVLRAVSIHHSVLLMALWDRNYWQSPPHTVSNSMMKGWRLSTVCAPRPGQWARAMKCQDPNCVFCLPNECPVSTGDPIKSVVDPPFDNVGWVLLTYHTYHRRVLYLHFTIFGTFNTRLTENGCSLLKVVRHCP